MREVETDAVKGLWQISDALFFVSSLHKTHDVIPAYCAVTLLTMPGSAKKSLIVI